jgi:hypothetical protein
MGNEPGVAFGADGDVDLRLAACAEDGQGALLSRATR